MTRSQLETMLFNLATEYDNRKRLGGYSADAPVIKFLTECCMLMAGHLVKTEKELNKLKRLKQPKSK